MNPNNMQKLGNLGAARKSRISALVTAYGEVRGGPLPLYFEEGRVFGYLPPELPVTALAPLLVLDQEIALLVRRILNLVIGKAAKTQADGTAAADEAESQQDIVAMFVDLLVMNPKLPTELINMATAIAANILGEEGMAGLAAERPSPEDIAELVKTAAAWFGASLGKLLKSSTPSTDGRTSEPTSFPPTPTSTSTTSSNQPAPASSVPVTHPATDDPALVLVPSAVTVVDGPPMPAMQPIEAAVRAAQAGELPEPVPVPPIGAV